MCLAGTLLYEQDYALEVTLSRRLILPHFFLNYLL